MYTESRVFFGQFCKTYSEFVQIGLCLRLDGNTYHWIRERHGLENYRVFFIAKRISGTDILETYSGTYVAGLDHLDRLLLFRVHLEYAGYTFFFIGTRVVNIRTSLELTGIHAEETKAAYERVGSDLERKCGHRLVCARMANNFFVRLGVDTGNGLYVHRRRQESHNGIEHLLSSFVFERRTAHHRYDVHRYGCLADSCDKFILGYAVRIREEFLHELFRSFGYRFNQMSAPFVAFVLEVFRDRNDLISHTLVLFVPYDTFHGKEVHNAFEVGLGTYRHLKGNRMCAQTLFHLFNHIEEVGTAAVHLVHETYTRNIVFVGLTPYSFRLGLNTAYRTEKRHGTVEYSQRTLNLCSEVHVPRSVYQVYLVLFCIGGFLALVGRIVPEHGSSGRGNRYASLLFLRHPVHRSGSVVHLAYLVGKSGVIKDTLAGCGLTGIDVGHDTDIPRIF